MSLHGHNLVGNERLPGTGASFRGMNPATGAPLEPEYRDAGGDLVDRAAAKAQEAFFALREDNLQKKLPAFLDRIAENLQALGDPLLRRAGEETALAEARLVSERGRTMAQLKTFAELLREGSWVEARIDRAQPDRKPLPKPDLRQRLVGLGPVAVFGASNFPLAFSAAGGDTASALAAGCPVIVKAHPAHPGASEMAGEAVLQAARETGMPEGIFSLLQGSTNAVGEALVRHPLVQAVGFTGSLRGGRALFDLAAARPKPIPVYAEMGSTNPVFLLPGALAERAEALAEGLHQSVTVGVGQFCTNPGLLVAIRSSRTETFLDALGRRIAATPPGTMLHRGICASYRAGLARWSRISGVRVLAQAPAGPDGTASAALLETDLKTYLASPELREELFGPATLAVLCDAENDLERMAREMDGQLTATLQGTEEDLVSRPGLLHRLEERAGRLVVNGFPTGVEVCPSLQHGGPYPASTDARTTSVGSLAIRRFARPVCYQNFPQALLPEALRNANPLGILRLVDGVATREAVA